MKGQREGQLAVVFGGTSGIGLELALILRETHTVVAVGPDKEVPEGIILDRLTMDTFEFGTGAGIMAAILDDHCESAGRVLDLVVLASTRWQEALLDDLTEADTEALLAEGLVGPISFLQGTLEQCGTIPTLIVATTMDAYRPYKGRQVSCAAKAGLRMFIEALSMGGRVGKTIFVAPTTAMPEDRVARHIMETFTQDFAYAELRCPDDACNTDLIGLGIRKLRKV